MTAVAIPKSDLSAKTSEELRRDLLGLIGLTVENLHRMAAIVAELERRGEDLAGLRLGLMPALRAIAAGQMLAEVAVRFAGRPGLWRAIGAIPIPEQRRLLDAGTVDVLVNDAVQTVELLALPAVAVRQVFAEDHIRDADEQRVVVAAGRRPRKDKPAESKLRYRVRPDAERHGVWIGKAFVGHAELVAAISAARGPLPVIDLENVEVTTATVRLTAVEKQKLKTAEKRRGLPEWHLIREALHAYGLI